MPAGLQTTPKLVPRPAGISLLAALNFVIAAAMAGVGAAMLVRGAAVLRSPIAQRVLHREGAGGVWFLVISSVVLAVLMGIGLLRLRDWGRQLMLIYCTIALVISGLMLLASLLRFATETAVVWLFLVIISAFILRYLRQPEIRQIFAPGPKSRTRGA